MTFKKTSALTFRGPFLKPKHIQWFCENVFTHFAHVSTGLVRALKDFAQIFTSSKVLVVRLHPCTPAIYTSGENVDTPSTDQKRLIEDATCAGSVRNTKTLGCTACKVTLCMTLRFNNQTVEHLYIPLHVSYRNSLFFGISQTLVFIVALPCIKLCAHTPSKQIDRCRGLHWANALKRLL